MKAPTLTLLTLISLVFATPAPKDDQETIGSSPKVRPITNTAFRIVRPRVDNLECPTCVGKVCGPSACTPVSKEETVSLQCTYETADKTLYWLTEGGCFVKDKDVEKEPNGNSDESFSPCMSDSRYFTTNPDPNDAYRVDLNHRQQ